MIRDFQINKNLSIGCQNILRQHERVQQQNPASQLECSRKAFYTLLDWGFPFELAEAVLLAPIIEYEPVHLQSFSENIHRESAELAKQLVSWHASFSVLDRPNVDLGSANYSILLHRLIRQSYLDLPKPYLVLFLLAEHDAHLALLRTKQTAVLSESVFSPLAEILGLWELRRQWLDSSYKILYPEQYTKMEKQIFRTEPMSEEVFGELFEENSISDPTNEGRNRRFSDRKIALGKASAYKKLRELLTRKFQQADFKILPVIELMQPHVSSYLWREKKEGRSKDWLTKRLRVRIICKSVQDCYQVLGIVHSLGKPILPRFSVGFRDFIASSKTNGYQAIHTAITFQGERNPTTYKEQNITVNFCILTKEMHAFNERGILEALFGPISPDENSKAWWAMLEENVRKETLAHDIGTRTEEIYVFTRQGDAFYLKDGSTALDFAYAVHTELGHHAVRIEVNDRIVPYNYPLHNGDLIHVHYDPNFRGPDLSWLGAVSTASAKQKIRHKLATHALAIHGGRHILETALIKAIDYYKYKRNFELIINSEHLDKFLLRTVKKFHLLDLENLYCKVEEERGFTERLIQHLISEELAGLIVHSNGDRLPYSRDHILLCNNCWPAPGDQIFGHEYDIHPTSSKGLKIHRKDNAHQQKLLKQEEKIQVQWTEQNNSKNRSILLFQIEAEDRPGILGEILSHIYANPGIGLNDVEAHTFSDGPGAISFIAEANTLNQLIGLLSLIETVMGVRNITGLPPASSDRHVAPDNSSKLNISNPYTYSEVFEPIKFYDRKIPINIILDWLKKPLPSIPLVLHGQRRVGKTSLARFIKENLLRNQYLVQPVFIDFQKASEFTIKAIAEQNIAREVCKALNMPEPQCLPGQDPMIWLSDVLEKAVYHLQKQNRRLFIIMDELNVLLDKANEKALDACIFANFRGLLNERRDINWLLIVQDTHYRDKTRIGSAASLFQQCDELPLQHFDKEWANKLIIKPAEGEGYKFDEIVPAEILKLTAGNPYFIQVVCYELINRAKMKNRSSISINDLRQIENIIYSRGEKYFHHFIYGLESIRKIVLIFIAHHCNEKEWVTVPEIIADILSKVERVDLRSLIEALKVLEHQGMITRQTDGNSEQVCIPIKLFKKYIELCMDLRTTIDDWNAIHPK